MKKSNTPKTWCFENASKRVLKSEQFATKLKHYLMVGVVLFLLATVVYSFFGFNLSNELKPHSAISVDFKNMVTVEEYADIENEVNTIIKNNGDFIVSFERSGEVVNTKLTIKLINVTYSTETLNSKLSQIKLDIEEKWADILNLEVSEPVSHTPYNDREVLSTLLAGLFILAGMFVFVWIRHEILSATAILIASIYNVGVLLSLLILLRIPLTLNFLSFFAVSVFVSSVIYILVADNIRKLELTGKKITNAKASQIAVLTILPIKLLVLTVVFAVALPLMIYLFIIGSPVLFTIIALLLSIIFGSFVGVFVAPACWASLYKRENDKRLKLRIEKQAQKELSKTNKGKKSAENEEKLLV